jgi:hypothetical protein
LGRLRIDLDGRHGDAPFRCDFFYLFLFKQQGFSGLECEGDDAVGGAGFDGLSADARDIEPHIVVHFGDFDGDGASVAAGQIAATGEARVGAFEAFDGEDDAIFDDDGLADVEPGNFLGDFMTESDVGELVGGEFWAEMKTWAWHEGLQPGERVDELDAVAAEFIGEGAEEGMGIFFFNFEE